MKSKRKSKMSKHEIAEIRSSSSDQGEITMIQAID